MTEQSISYIAQRNRTNFWAALFGICAAPLFWFGQLTLGYIVSSYACYGSDHPTAVESTAMLRAVLVTFDALALVVAIAGGIVSYVGWYAVRDEKEEGDLRAIDILGGRMRFMAIWGLLSSLWFFGSILFTTITSSMVPLCEQ